MHIKDDNYEIIKASCDIDSYMTKDYYLDNNYISDNIKKNDKLSNLLSKQKG